MLLGSCDAVEPAVWRVSLGVLRVVHFGLAVAPVQINSGAWRVTRDWEDDGLRLKKKRRVGGSEARRQRQQRQPEPPVPPLPPHPHFRFCLPRYCGAAPPTLALPNTFGGFLVRVSHVINHNARGRDSLLEAVWELLLPRKLHRCLRCLLCCYPTASSRPSP